MDPQYSLTSREDIWRVFEEVRDIHATQLEHGERISRLERRRDDDSRLRSFWGPWSPLPMAVGGAMQPEPSLTPAADAFKGFDQGQQQALMNNTGLEGEEEPRRGASRANSVRFDESAIHGYYGQNRSSSELPLRTGSGMDGHPLTERSLSHRSDGRLSSSGHSHHSARTNSLGLEGSKLIPSASGSPSNITAPPGLFLLGPLPCIIRCWLTTSFSNDSLLYAAVCSGSYSSFLGFPLIEKLGLEEQIAQKGNMRCIKLRLYLPEASIHPASSRASSPTPQLPTLTIRFLVRETDPSDKSIQILIGSDVLRSHNADILFSQEKIIMIDDERKRVSIPLVRPENDSAFKSLSTASEASRPASSAGCNGNEHTDTNGDIAGVIARPPAISPQQSSTSPTLRASEEAFDGIDKPPSTHSEADHDDSNSQSTHTKSVVDSESTFATPAKQENAGVWGGSWRRDSKLDSNAVGMAKSTRGRSMKVLRPSKSTSSRVGHGASSNASTVSDVVSSPAADSNRQPRQLSPINPPETLHPTPSRSASLNSGDSSWPSKQRSANPVGGASAFGWLNSSPQAKRPTGNE